MAYGVFMAAVSPGEVESFRSDHSHLPVPQLITSITHLAAYWIKVQPLAAVASEVIDGGEEVSATLWHPLRTPRYHKPTAVKELLPRLSEAWALAQRPPVTREVPWFRYDVEAVLESLRFAAESDLGVVTALTHPFDEERARRILTPIAGVIPESSE
jgi:hypothetical protein